MPRERGKERKEQKERQREREVSGCAKRTSEKRSGIRARIGRSKREEEGIGKKYKREREGGNDGEVEETERKRERKRKKRKGREDREWVERRKGIGDRAKA